MITPHETSTNLQWVTIHGEKHLKMKPAPIYRQLPTFEKSKEGPPFVGCNTKITPPEAVKLADDIKYCDGMIARVQRRFNAGRAHYPEQERDCLEELKQDRAKLQAERAFIMEQANPKKEPKPTPKKRAMRKKPTRFKTASAAARDLADALIEFPEEKGHA